MDTRIMFASTLLVTLAINTGMALVYWTRRTYPGFGYWLAGSFCRSLGAVLFLLPRHQFPPWLTIIFANYLFLLELLLFIRGTLLFRGQPPQSHAWDIAISLSFCALFAHFIYLAPNHGAARIVVFSLYICGLELWMLWVILTRRPAYFGAADVCQAWMWGILAFSSLVRAGYTWRFEAWNVNIMITPITQAVMVLLLVVAALLISLTQIIMNAQRVEYDHKAGNERLEKELIERRQIEQELREERQRLAGIIRGTNAGTWEWHVQTGEVVFNERWAEIIGYSLEELSPISIETWKKFTHPDDLRASDAMLEKHFQEKLDYYEIEVRMKHKNGGWVWVLDRGSVTEWTEDGKPRLMMGTHQDVSERKRAEDEQEKLEGLLNQARKMESVGRLAGGVAHDFNNMLGVILGHTEMAMEQVEPFDPVFSDLKEIEKAARRSADLTRQLLAFARQQTIVPRVLNLNETVEGMLTLLRRLIGEEIDLAWLPGERLWEVKMDPSQIDQVLANLCVNARDAINGVGTVTIETRNVFFDENCCFDQAGFSPGEYVLLAVSDNGCGMDRETRDRIFEPFFTTKEHGRGTGLGLATVYGIARQNEGFINVYSEPGQGTTFRLYLPRHAAKYEGAFRESPAWSETQRHATVLLVEDEVSILAMTSRMLERMGYTVLAASTPREAVRIAESYAGQIHLLMTDVVMPETNGRELAGNLLAFYPDLKTLFMSGYTANVIAHHGVLDEGVNFIQKPFSMRELAAKLDLVLGNRMGEVM